LALSLCLPGCSEHYYNPTAQVLPQNVRRIAVRPFANRTKTPGLSDRLTMAVRAALTRDGRWQIVDEEQADGVLIGEVKHYLRMPLKHDSNNVTTEYKVRVLADISFYDVMRKQTLWQERNLEATLTAPPSSSGLPGGITEVEAQEKLWDQLAQDIATRTFEGFGTVTGVSEKSVPQSSPNTTLPSAPPSDSFNAPHYP